MDSFSVFNDELRHAYENDALNSQAAIANISSASNIERQIRSLISIQNLRDNGSFFTSDEIAQKAVLSLEKEITENSIVCDPTCGAGNLLIAASSSLPVFESLERTLDLWGKALRGFDIVPEFVECTKLRLILEAIRRGATKRHSSLECLEEKLKNIKVGSIYENLDSLTSVSHVLINPPYTLENAPEDCRWASGKVNAAAVFMDAVLDNLTSTTVFTAILPEVLRSGSRYEKWRYLITEKVSVTSSILGRFNSNTDVDVFLLSGSTSKTRLAGTGCWVEQKKGTPQVGDKFDICIGPLVAYRDEEIGNSVPYLYSKILKPWEVVEEIALSRKTKTRLITPPFVVVKRTSSPSDKSRAVASLILGDKPVAVENHLIVLKPKRGGQNICKKLLKTLKHENTNDFLNERIRCRHLTVGAVKEIPWMFK